MPCTSEEFAKYDAVLVSTPHSAFKNPALYASVKLAIDTRNIIAPNGSTRIVKS